MVRHVETWYEIYELSVDGLMKIPKGVSYGMPYSLFGSCKSVEVAENEIANKGEEYTTYVVLPMTRIVSNKFATTGLSVSPNDCLANEDWIRERWGGFTYLIIGRNDDFMFDFKDGSLWLHCENDSLVCRVLLLESPTRNGVIGVERLFGVSS